MMGLMQDRSLTITAIMDFAEKVFAQQQIVSMLPSGQSHRYTYADAFARVRRLGNVLQGLGVARGERVATLAWNNYRHFELYYAISSFGAICHTINPRLFAEQLRFIINQAEDRCLFVDPAFVPLVEALQASLPTVAIVVVLCAQQDMPSTSLTNALCYETLLAAADSEFDWPLLQENEAAAMCYTSGTTGNPKGVVYSHRSTVLHSYAAVMPDVMALSARDVVMPVVPMFHANAWGLPYAAPMVGAKLVFPGAGMGDGAVLQRLINQEGVTVAAGVPTVWLALLAHLHSAGGRIDSLQRVVVGGAACPLKVMSDFDAYGVYTHAAWGMTETSPLGVFNTRLDRAALGEPAFAEWRQKAGRAIFGVEMKIVDDEDRELPWDGEAFGSLKVRGPWIAQSYYPQLPACDEQGWFTTGDVATIDARGYMQITDRSKDVIKSGGEWISSIELENTAVNHPGVAEAAVIGVAHSKWTERPLLLVVKKPGAQLEREAMLAWFEGRVARWWIPEDCQFVDALAHTATGKLDKKVLRQQFSAYRFASDDNKS